MALLKKQENIFFNRINKFKREAEKGNWTPILKSMIEAFDFDAAFYIESSRDEKGELHLNKEPCLVNLDDKYEETYLSIRKKGYPDFLYLARFILPFDVYSHRQLYETKEYRKQLKITGEYEQNAYYLGFHKIFGIKDVATYGCTDPKTGIDYNVSFILYENDRERKKAQRTNPVIKADDRENIKNTVSKFPPFDRHLSEIGNSGIAKQNPLMPLREELSTEQYRDRIFDLLEEYKNKTLEIESHQEALNIMELVVNDFQWLISQYNLSEEDLLRTKCPALHDWTGDKEKKKEVLKRVTDPENGRSRLENAKEFLDRVLAEAGIEEMPYLHVLRRVHEPLVVALHNLANRKDISIEKLIPVADIRATHKTVSLDEYKNAVKIVSGWKTQQNRKVK